MTHDALCAWASPCIHAENKQHSRDKENPSVPDAQYCFLCGADCLCELIARVRFRWPVRQGRPAMGEHLPECPVEKRLRDGNTVASQTCICDALRACEKRVREDERSYNLTPDDHSDGMTESYQRGLAAARDSVAENHQPMPVVQCACGWGADCPECGYESNRIVGQVCRICCDDWGDHGYCSDFHNLDDKPFHHVNGEMWSGQFCPVLAAIDAFRGGDD